MALTLDASTPSKVAGTTTAITTASFTPPADSLLVAFLGYNSSGAGTNQQTVTDSGGLTWTMQGLKSNDAASTGGAGTAGGAEIWTATQTTSAARTVTTTQTGSLDHTLVVKVFTDTGGAPTAGAIAATSSASGLPTASVTTTATNSWVWAASSDWNALGAGTAGSGQTLSTGDENSTAGVSTHVWRQTSTTPTASSVTNNLTAPSAQQYNELIFEVKANTAAVAGAPIIVQPPRRP